MHETFLFTVSEQLAHVWQSGRKPNCDSRRRRRRRYRPPPPVRARIIAPLSSPLPPPDTDSTTRTLDVRRPKSAKSVSAHCRTWGCFVDRNPRRRRTIRFRRRNGASPVGLLRSLAATRIHRPECRRVRREAPSEMSLPPQQDRPI
jgi:hypothetical protein